MNFQFNKDFVQQPQINKVTNFKAFLINGESSEARRFSVENAAYVTKYDYMRETLQTVYPILREYDFRMSWKDEDGDQVTISTDADLITAINEMTGNVKQLYATVLKPHKNDDVEIEGEEEVPFGNGRVICDACDTVIKGFRYKCITCPDYDLCTKCEQCGLHSEHIMIRVPNSEVFMPRCARKFIHHFARSMKKAHHIASKEAHRAAKYASKAHEKFAPKVNEEPKASTSGKETPNTKAKCPMEDHMNNLGNLGYMTIEPLMDMFAGQNTEAVPGRHFAEAVRKAINAFMDGVAQPKPTNENQGNENQNNGTQRNENQPTPNPTSDDGQTPSPMDVEHLSQEHNNTVTVEKPDTDWLLINQQSNEEDPKIVEGLKTLQEMGFNHEEYLIALLKRFNGNVEAVVKHLLESE